MYYILYVFCSISSQDTFLARNVQSNVYDETREVLSGKLLRAKIRCNNDNQGAQWCRAACLLSFRELISGCIRIDGGVREPLFWSQRKSALCAFSFGPVFSEQYLPDNEQHECTCKAEPYVRP